MSAAAGRLLGTCGSDVSVCMLVGSCCCGVVVDACAGLCSACGVSVVGGSACGWLLTRGVGGALFCLLGVRERALLRDVGGSGGNVPVGPNCWYC